MKNFFEIFAIPQSFAIDYDNLEKKYLEFQNRFHPDKSSIQDLEDNINNLTLQIKSRSKESQEARNLAAKRNALQKRANDMKKNYETKFGSFESNLIDDNKINTDDSVYEEIESIVDKLKDNDSFIKEFSGLSDTFKSLEKDDASKTLDKLKLFESKLEKNQSALKDKKDKYSWKENYFQSDEILVCLLL